MPLFLVESKIAPINERMTRLIPKQRQYVDELFERGVLHMYACLLYTSPSPRDGLLSRMPSSA